VRGCRLGLGPRLRAASGQRGSGSLHGRRLLPGDSLELRLDHDGLQELRHAPADPVHDRLQLLAQRTPGSTAIPTGLSKPPSRRTLVPLVEMRTIAPLPGAATHASPVTGSTEISRAATTFSTRARSVPVRSMSSTALPRASATQTLPRRESTAMPIGPPRPPIVLSRTPAVTRNTWRDSKEVTQTERVRL